MTINTTPNRGYPWPDNTEAVANGWDAIRDLAVAVDTDMAAAATVVAQRHAGAATETLQNTTVTYLPVHAELGLVKIAPPTGKLLVTLNASCDLSSAGAGDHGLWALMDETGALYADSGGQFVRGTGLIARRSRQILLAGLTPGVAYTLRWAHAVTLAGSGANIYTGGSGVYGAAVMAATDAA